MPLKTKNPTLGRVFIGMLQSVSASTCELLSEFHGPLSSDGA
jgi:hypothetical protein